MVWDLLLAFGIGVLVGYLVKGRQDKRKIFMIGLVVGIILAVAMVLIGTVADVKLGAEGLGTAAGLVAGVAVFISVLLLTLVFILGVFVGDWLEHRGKPARTA